MSDVPMLDRVAGLGSRDAIRGVTRAWWLFLILGVLWILFGMFVLSYNVGSLLALAIFAGITLIMTGINQILTSGRVDGAGDGSTWWAAPSRSSPGSSPLSGRGGRCW